MVISGCNRGAEPTMSPEAADTSAAPLASLPESSKETDRIYSVDQYDPDRDVETDLRETIELAKADRKRIILEVGGQW